MLFPLVAFIHQVIFLFMQVLVNYHELAPLYCDTMSKSSLRKDRVRACVNKTSSKIFPYK